MREQGQCWEFLMFFKQFVDNSFAISWFQMKEKFPFSSWEIDIVNKFIVLNWIR